MRRPPEWWHKTHGTGRITMITIAKVREWSEELLGTTSTLVIERDGERNRVFLRFSMPSGIGECDVTTLWALHRGRATNAELREQIVEACRPVCVA